MSSGLRMHVLLLAALFASGVTLAAAQGLGGAGAVQGVVKDAAGGVLPGATVAIANPVSGFKRDTRHRRAGSVHLSKPAAERVSRAGQPARVPDIGQGRGCPNIRPD